MKLKFAGGICGTMVVCLTMSAVAATKPKLSPSAVDAVQELLQTESQAENSAIDRREALELGSRSDADAGSLWWQAGYIQSGKHWRRYEETVAIGEDASLLDAYREQRAELSDRPHGQWRLANWCRKNGLLDQERVHLLQVLADRDQAGKENAIYERLGCQKKGNVWVSPQERQEAAKQSSEIELSHKQWSSKLNTLAQQFEGTPKQRALSEKQLAEMTHPSAVPAIVATFCVSTQSLAERGVKTLGQIPEYQASRALAGQAVLSPWKPVRSKATELLKQRKLTEFVPDLLLLLANPIRTNLEVTVQASPRVNRETPAFRTNWDYVWMEESHDTIQVGIRRLFPISTPADLWASRNRQANPADIAVGLAELYEQAEQLENTVEKLNDRRTSMNDRVGKVLSDCANEPVSSDPNLCWSWWSVLSYGGSPNQKGVIVVDERKMQPNIPSLSTVPRHSCLVAGTPVWTERGFVAIEQIQRGDRVLSKDVDSGELNYKPVLQTTVRPPTPVQKFRVAGDTFVASLGHHFWVSGDGWTKMRELIPDHPLHTATGMQRVTSVEDEGRVEKVYNLIVADFHTYFVGSAMVLSHDVLPPSLTNVKVPGMTPR